jgi:hypothetical protein
MGWPRFGTEKTFNGKRRHYTAKLMGGGNPISMSGPIYVFPIMKMRCLVISKQNYNVLSPNFHIHVSVSDFIYS